MILNDFFDDETNQRVTQRQIEDVLDSSGIWKGHSQEWRYSTYTDFTIVKHEKEHIRYDVKAKCGGYEISLPGLRCIEDALLALDSLHSALIRIGRDMKRD